LQKRYFQRGTALEIERLRKHIATIRVFGLPKEIKVKDGFRQSKEFSY
jgi:hypothetical protein